MSRGRGVEGSLRFRWMPVGRVEGGAQRLFLSLRSEAVRAPSTVVVEGTGWGQQIHWQGLWARHCCGKEEGPHKP